VDKILIQIFGVQRSGTTYTSNLINMNYKNVMVYADGKHRMVLSAERIRDNLDKRIAKNKESEGNDNLLKRLIYTKKMLFELNKKIYPVVVIKNPYSWYLSISRWTQLYGNKFEVGVWYERFNRMYKDWKKLLENPHKPFGKGIINTYEDLLRNKDDFIYTLIDKCGLKLKGKIHDTDRIASVRRDAKNELKFFTEERRQFYLQDGDFGLSKKLIKQITKLVDWELMEFYGYKPK
jgi:hypothetical protein